MKDVADALSFFSTDAGQLRFFALLFPGFIALAVYDLRVPGERRKWGDMGVALVAYSILIDVFSAVYLKFFPITVGATAQAVWFGILADLVVPAAVGWFVVEIREALAEKGLVLSAMPKAWDEFFRRIQNQRVALVATLKDGRKVGGFWAENPLASSYPADEDLLIPVPVSIDAEGLFVERIADSMGLLISRDDILTIEAFDADAVAAASNAAAAAAAAHPTRSFCKEHPWLRATR
jgi:hypothetical protein